PTGILNNIDLIEYNYDLQDGDIILMCSDGIIESNQLYTNKELWIQDILEDIETDDAQRIADLVLNEAIDNDFGQEKDDMTVIVCKINKK
ncbi:MAG: SpoIIE family protein phosphatase, partial [Clostridia bacterium]